jgi:hypothetical protein
MILSLHRRGDPLLPEKEARPGRVVWGRAVTGVLDEATASPGYRNRSVARVPVPAVRCLPLFRFGSVRSG